MQRPSFKAITFASAMALVTRLAQAAAEVEPQAAAIPYTDTPGPNPLLSVVAQGLLLALLIGIGAAMVAAFRKPPTRW